MKQNSMITVLTLCIFFMLPATGSSQDSTRQPARMIIDSTSEKSDHMTGRNIKKLSLKKEKAEITDSVCHKKKGRKSKTTRVRS